MMRQPDSAAAADGMIVLSLVTGDRIYFRRHEIPRALLHRRALPYQIVGLMGQFILPTRPEFYDLTVLERVIVCTLGGTVTMVLILGAVLLMERYRPRGETFHIHASPFIAAGVLAGMLSANVVLSRFMGVSTNLAQTLVIWAFFHVYVEAIHLLIVYRAFPGIIRELRAPLAAVPAAEPVPEVVIGGQAFGPCSLVRIEADGNYLKVVTATGNRFVPGPFGKVVAGLPETLGLRVGRSDWVAAGAVAGLRSEGREMAVLLHGGGEVPVAQSRRKAVADWVRALPSREPEVEPEREVVRGPREDSGEGIVGGRPQHA